MLAVPKISFQVDICITRISLIDCHNVCVCVFIHRRNEVVQKHIFNYINDLLRLNVAIPDMAEMLTEVCE